MNESPEKKRGLLDWLWPKGQAWRALIFAGLFLVGIATLFAALVDNWSNTSKLSDLANIFGSVVTVFAIVLGGVFAMVKLQAFRDFKSHLTVSHKVSHRAIGKSYIHIEVTAELRNSSKVLVEVQEGVFLLQRISPASDSEIEALFEQTFVEREKRDIQWPTLYELSAIWNKGELTVEPGESHYETIEFIISTEIKSVIIYTYFSNPSFPLSSATPKGWAASTIYDISSGQ